MIGYDVSDMSSMEKLKLIKEPEKYDAEIQRIKDVASKHDLTFEEATEDCIYDILLSSAGEYQAVMGDGCCYFGKLLAKDQDGYFYNSAELSGDEILDMMDKVQKRCNQQEKPKLFAMTVGC